VGCRHGRRHRAPRGFNPRDFDLGHKLRLVDGEHVFGDGAGVCLEHVRLFGRNKTIYDP
jgi:hypothetical protein